MRDMYDIWFFAKNNWDINAEVIQARNGKTIKAHIADYIPVIETVKDNEILRGLAELLLRSCQKITFPISSHLHTICV